MARRKKNLTLEEQLLELEMEVESCEEEIKKYTEKKKELKNMIEQKQMEALHQAVMKSGKSIGEIISLIENYSNNGETGQEQGEHQEGM